MTDNHQIERPWCSPEIDKIAGALAQAQASFGKLIADKTGKISGESKKSGKAFEYSYRYADLGDALEACRSCLNSQGIAVLQMPATPGRNGIEVTTTLVHSSGQWLRSDPLFMPCAGGAQDVGSAITYARRYSLLAMVGLAPEDDDGAKAQGAAPSSWNNGEQRGKPAPAKSRKGADDIGPRCTGKAEPIAIAIDELATELSAIIKKDKWLIYRSAVKHAGIDLAPYDNVAPNPSGLLIADGKAVKAKLEAKLAAEVTRQPGDDADDPTGEAAP